MQGLLVARSDEATISNGLPNDERTPAAPGDYRSCSRCAWELHRFSDRTLRTISKSMNEGATELLTTRVDSLGGIEPKPGAYIEEFAAMKGLEQVIGKEPFLRLYFQGDVKGVIEALNRSFGTTAQYGGEARWKLFVDLMNQEQFDWAKEALSDSQNDMTELRKSLQKYGHKVP
jgi:hypothetical protein